MEDARSLPKLVELSVNANIGCAMQITFARDTIEFHALSDGWNDLLDRAATDVPFLRHEYLSSWWSTLGGGEWQAGELWVGVGRDDHGGLLCLAPLFLTQTREGKKGLMFLGSIEISDHLDLIVLSESAASFTEDLFAALEVEGPEDWQVLDLYNIPEDSPSLPALEGSAERRGWDIRRERLQPCPVIVFDGTWENYLAKLAKKQRHELRRKMRRAAQYPGGVTWRIIRPEEDIEAATDAFMKLMATDPRKLKFLTPNMRSQFRRSIQAAHDNGWLHLSFLEVGGKRAAAYLSFDYGGQLWLYNSGINPAYQSLSPGLVLLGHLIQWAINQGRREFNFLRGDEAYKYRMGGVDRYITRLTITR